MSVRCKFRCESKTERRSPNCESVLDFEFMPVCSGSEENKEFWRWTPGGHFRVSSVRTDLFVIGAEYYIDLTQADA